MISLTKVKMPIGQHWAVYTYCLNDDLTKNPSLPNELYGLIIHLGVYKTEEEAQNRVKELIQTTSYGQFRIAKLGLWAEMRDHSQDHMRVLVDEQTNKIEFFETQTHKRDEELRQERERIITESKAELLEDPSSPEYKKLLQERLDKKLEVLQRLEAQLGKYREECDHDRLKIAELS